MASKLQVYLSSSWGGKPAALITEVRRLGQECSVSATYTQNVISLIQNYLISEDQNRLLTKNFKKFVDGLNLLRINRSDESELTLQEHFIKNPSDVDAEESAFTITQISGSRGLFYKIKVPSKKSLYDDITAQPGYYAYREIMQNPSIGQQIFLFEEKRDYVNIPAKTTKIDARLNTFAMELPRILFGQELLGSYKNQKAIDSLSDNALLKYHLRAHIIWHYLRQVKNKKVVLSLWKGKPDFFKPDEEKKGDSFEVLIQNKAVACDRVAEFRTLMQTLSLALDTPEVKSCMLKQIQNSVEIRNFEEIESQMVFKKASEYEAAKKTFEYKQKSQKGANAARAPPPSQKQLVKKLNTLDYLLPYEVTALNQIFRLDRDTVKPSVNTFNKCERVHAKLYDCDEEFTPYYNNLIIFQRTRQKMVALFEKRKELYNSQKVQPLDEEQNDLKSEQIFLQEEIANTKKEIQLLQKQSQKNLTDKKNKSRISLKEAALANLQGQISAVEAQISTEKLEEEQKLKTLQQTLLQEIEDKKDFISEISFLTGMTSTSIEEFDEEQVNQISQTIQKISEMPEKKEIDEFNKSFAKIEKIEKCDDKEFEQIDSTQANKNFQKKEKDTFFEESKRQSKGTIEDTLLYHGISKEKIYAFTEEETDSSESFIRKICELLTLSFRISNEILAADSDSFEDIIYAQILDIVRELYLEILDWNPIFEIINITTDSIISTAKTARQKFESSIAQSDQQGLVVKQLNESLAFISSQPAKIAPVAEEEKKSEKKTQKKFQEKVRIDFDAKFTYRRSTDEPNIKTYLGIMHNYFQERYPRGFEGDDSDLISRNLIELTTSMVDWTVAYQQEANRSHDVFQRVRKTTAKRGILLKDVNMDITSKRDITKVAFEAVETSQLRFNILEGRDKTLVLSNILKQLKFKKKDGEEVSITFESADFFSQGQIPLGEKKNIDRSWTDAVYNGVPVKTSLLSQAGYSNTTIEFILIMCKLRKW